VAWSDKSLELEPVEHREVDVKEQFSCQVLCPADSVALVTLEDIK
jgi:hypothetical protein